MNDTPHEAMLYEKEQDLAVRCNLCAHHCRIPEGKRGLCQVRENREGILYSLVYGRPISQHVDPIEKKPLFHFYPGSSAYSIATAGCNFRCQWCQNWQISQMPREYGAIRGQKVTPQQIVQQAVRAECRSIAHTYTEPTVFFEYSYDIAKLGQEKGLSNVYVTNGYMSAEMLELFAPYLDAANVDLKAFRDETYRKYVGAKLQPVLESLAKMKELGIWVEVTTLVIPNLNDSDQELTETARFVREELGEQTPWHISRFFPAYQLKDRPPTPLVTLQRAYEIGEAEGLKHVYVGNARLDEGEDTLCPQCGRILIERSGYGIRANHIVDGACPDCGTKIAGVGMSAR